MGYKANLHEANLHKANLASTKNNLQKDWNITYKSICHNIVSQKYKIPLLGIVVIYTWNKIKKDIHQLLKIYIYHIRKLIMVKEMVNLAMLFKIWNESYRIHVEYNVIE
jgi:hypothetical protein